MTRIAIVCAPGIGDALIFQIASCQLQRGGYETVIFSNHLRGFGEWLKGFSFAPQPLPDTSFAGFDAVFLQHDNSDKARRIHSLEMPIYTFYGSHLASKHGPLRAGFDYVCDPDQTMVDNVLNALQSLFGLKSPTAENGLSPPPGLIHRRYNKRIAIHPLSGASEKNWPRPSFQKVVKSLQEEGFEPVFLIPPSEGELWEGRRLSTLAELSSFIYESGFFLGNDSGPGHIASYLKIPHLIIGKEEKQMRLWRPGWMPGTLITPPHWIPNWKGLRLRERHWKKFISTRRIINALKNNVLHN